MNINKKQEFLRFLINVHKESLEFISPSESHTLAEHIASDMCSTDHELGGELSLAHAFEAFTIAINNTIREKIAKEEVLILAAIKKAVHLT